MFKPGEIGLRLLGMFALLAFGATGCSREQDDRHVTMEVQDRIRADRRLKTSVQVRADHGIVTLSGSVGSAAERVAAAQDAGQVEGVKVVADNLKVINPYQSGTALVFRKPNPSVPMALSKPQVSTALRPEATHAALPTSGFDRPVLRATSPVSTTVPPPASPGGLIASDSSDFHAASTKTPETTPSAPPTAIPLGAPAPVPPEEVTIPSGTSLTVRLMEPVSSGANQTGDTFLANLASPVMVSDRVVIPAEASVQGKILDVRSAGHFSGRSELVIQLTRLAYNGKTYELRTNQYSKQGPRRDARSVAVIGGGAGLGAVIGAILGGGKGAAIGALIGGGTGTGVQAATKAAAAQLPTESVLSFRLQSTLTVLPSSTLQQPQNTASDSSKGDPFSDWRPVLKRRPDSVEAAPNAPGASSAPGTGPALPKD